MQYVSHDFFGLVFVPTYNHGSFGCDYANITRLCWAFVLTLACELFGGHVFVYILLLYIRSSVSIQHMYIYTYISR